MSDGSTALMRAAAKGHAGVVRALLLAGSDRVGLEVEDKSGLTALLHAVKHDNAEVSGS